MNFYKITIIRKTGRRVDKYRFGKDFHDALDQALDGVEGFTCDAVESGEIELRFVKIGDKNATK